MAALKLIFLPYTIWFLIDQRSLQASRDEIGEGCDLEEPQTPPDGREGHPHTSFYSQDILPSAEFCVLRVPVS